MLSPLNSGRALIIWTHIFRQSKLYFSAYSTRVFFAILFTENHRNHCPDKNLGGIGSAKFEIHPKPTALFYRMCAGLCKAGSFIRWYNLAAASCMDQDFSGNCGRFYSPDGNQFYFINTEKLCVLWLDKEDNAIRILTLSHKGYNFNIKKNNNQLWIASTYQIYIYNINNNMEKCSSQRMTDHVFPSGWVWK